MLFSRDVRGSVLKLARTIRYGGWAIGVIRDHGWPRKVISYNSGIGDDLLCTTVAHELRKRSVENVWVATKYLELFEGNPDVSAVPISDWRFATLARLLGAEVRPLWYTKYELDTDRDPEPPQHIAAMMCEKAEITGTVLIRPYLSLCKSEIGQGRIAENQIAIQSTTRGADTPLQNKEWLPERFQSVVDALSSQFTFVQLGTAADPRLDNVIDLRGKTTLREAAAILSRSNLFVGLVSGLMHLARAVDCPAVIVYGGRERPEISGYICNINIRTYPPCAPCWQRNRCDNARVCMTAIDADMVLAGIKELLDRHRDELPVEETYLN